MLELALASVTVAVLSVGLDVEGVGVDVEFVTVAVLSIGLDVEGVGVDVGFVVPGGLELVAGASVVCDVAEDDCVVVSGGVVAETVVAGFEVDVGFVEEADGFVGAVVGLELDSTNGVSDDVDGEAVVVCPLSEDGSKGVVVCPELVPHLEF